MFNPNEEKERMKNNRDILRREGKLNPTKKLVTFEGKVYSKEAYEKIIAARKNGKVLQFRRKDMANDKLNKLIHDSEVSYGENGEVALSHISGAKVSGKFDKPHSPTSHLKLAEELERKLAAAEAAVQVAEVISSLIESEDLPTLETPVVTIEPKKSSKKSPKKVKK